jgi:hypothetical protein
VETKKDISKQKIYQPANATGNLGNNLGKINNELEKLQIKLKEGN